MLTQILFQNDFIVKKTIAKAAEYNNIFMAYKFLVLISGTLPTTYI